MKKICSELKMFYEVLSIETFWKEVCSYIEQEHCHRKIHTNLNVS